MLCRAAERSPSGISCESNRVAGCARLTSDTGMRDLSALASIEKIFDPGLPTKAGSPGLASVCRKVIEQHSGEIRVRYSNAVEHIFDPVADFWERPFEPSSCGGRRDIDVAPALEREFSKKRLAGDDSNGVSDALMKFRQAPCSLVVTGYAHDGDGDGNRRSQGVRPGGARHRRDLFSPLMEPCRGCLAMKEGACDYLMKPVSFEQLEEAGAQNFGRACDARKADSNDQQNAGIFGESAR